MQDKDACSDELQNKLNTLKKALADFANSLPAATRVRLVRVENSINVSVWCPKTNDPVFEFLGSKLGVTEW